MKTISPLPQDKKLTIVIRVEPGCLGPEGIDHVEEFCNVAQIEINALYSDFINWEVVPRFNKLLAETQYKVTNKTLTLKQAEKYLGLFNKGLDQFEEHVNEKLATLINQHLAH